MKEIKAYVRARMASAVVDALVRANCRAFSFIEVRGIAVGVTQDRDISVELGDRYVHMLKIELVCPDERVDEIVETIRSAAHTGNDGDGAIFVAPVEQAVRICNGARNAAALAPQ